MTRRSWLKSAASGALGFGAAKAGFEKLIPAVISPDQTIPGVSTWYATTCRECPAGCGMLARLRENRPVKCEGNPLHPVSQGKLCARGQASVQGLYDPDRVAGPMVRDDAGLLAPTTWDAALGKVAASLYELNVPDSIAFVGGVETGALAELTIIWLLAHRSERYLRYEALAGDLAQASDRVFGPEAPPVPAVSLSDRDCILSFGADFLDTWLSPVKFAAEFASARDANPSMRATYVGPRLSCTAAAADEWYLVPPGYEVDVALAVLHEVAEQVDDAIVDAVADGGALSSVPRKRTLLRLAEGFSADSVSERTGIPAQAIRAMATRFASARRPIALGGDGEAAIAAALLNSTAPAFAEEAAPAHALGLASSMEDMRRLTEDMRAGLIEVLFIHGANPVHTLPPELGFAEALQSVPMVVSLSTMRDETAELCTVHLPTHHPLESWGDFEPEGGLACITQPLLSPLLDTRTVGDVLLDIAQADGTDLRTSMGCESFYDFLRMHWRRSHINAADETGFEKAWRDAVRIGYQHSSGEATTIANAPLLYRAGSVLIRGIDDVEPGLSGPLLGLAPSVGNLRLRGGGVVEGLRLHTPPSITLYDGRDANKPWLQELPEPMTKTVWGTVVELHPETAKSYRISTGDLVTVKRDEATLRAPAYVWDGVARDTVVIQLGGGHTALGEIAAGVGQNAFALLPASAAGVTTVEISTDWARRTPVSPQGGDEQHGRRIVETLEESELEHLSLADRALSLPLPEGYESEYDMYPGHEHRNHRWAMVIDLDKCSGCGACVVACFAENNIATVGPDQVRRGHEMAWLRIDRYFEESERTPVLFLPMMCQQCDSAPCEPVCPTYAAVHSEDGINAQIYNRCVGTRYCANNCPYKMRRFNWFDHDWPEPSNMQLNPDVTVRGRGVMEKCNFCVQRIREAGHIAKGERRPVRDGDAKPACVQTCPMGAMVFGDLMDGESRVSALIRTDPRAYQVLHELNTKPGVIYLRKVVRQV